MCESLGEPKAKALKKVYHIRYWFKRRLCDEYDIISQRKDPFGFDEWRTVKENDFSMQANSGSCGLVCLPVVESPARDVKPMFFQRGVRALRR